MNDKVQAAVSILKQRLNRQPQIWIILGSGNKSKAAVSSGGH
jgi:purine nucleoside phosphorylase